MKHTRKSALETTVGDLRDALSGIAASVHSPLGGSELAEILDMVGEAAVNINDAYGKLYTLVHGDEPDDDEDAEEDEPTEIPLTAEQKRMEDYLEEEDNERTFRNEADSDNWHEPDEED